MSALGGVSIDREDFWRWPVGASTAGARYQEWQHFVVFAEGLELIVNFSLRALRGGEASPNEARLVVLGRGERWWGFVDEVDPREVEGAPDGRAMRFGASAMRLRPDGYFVTVSAPERGVSLELALRPAALPMVVRRSQITPGRRLDWVVVPRLKVEGAGTIDGRAVCLDGVAYHDHNWGCFDWGDDYTWEWGALLCEGEGEPLTVLYSAGMNRARTRLHYEYAVAWQGEGTALSASGPDVSVAWSGRRREAAALRVPGVMSLLRPRVDADVPEVVTVDARNGSDRVEARFAVESTSEVIIPSDGDPLGSMALHECVGPVSVDATLGGRRLRQGGRGVFEFVRA